MVFAKAILTRYFVVVQTYYEKHQLNRSTAQCMVQRAMKTPSRQKKERKFQADHMSKTAAIRYAQVAQSDSSSGSEGEGSGISFPLLDRRLQAKSALSSIHLGQTNRKNDLGALPLAQVFADNIVLSRQARDLHAGQTWHNANGIPSSSFDTSKKPQRNLRA